VLAQNSHPELGFWKSIVLFFSLWVSMFIGSESSQSGSSHQRFLSDWEMKNHRSPTLWQSVKTARILITKNKAKHRRKDSEELGRNSVLVSPESWWALKGRGLSLGRNSRSLNTGEGVTWRHYPRREQPALEHMSSVRAIENNVNCYRELLSEQRG